MDRMKIIDKKTGKAKYLVDEENRVVDLEQQLPRGDVLAPLDGTLADSPIHPRGNVDAGRIRFALDDERLGPREVPDRETHDGCENDRHNGRGSRRASRRPFAPRFGFGAIFLRRALFYVRHAMLVSRGGVCAALIAGAAQARHQRLGHLPHLLYRGAGWRVRAAVPAIHHAQGRTDLAYSKAYVPLSYSLKQSAPRTGGRRVNPR